MAEIKRGTSKTCPNGHSYIKSSDCPTCPVCEQQSKTGNFLDEFAGPARRALQAAGITTLKQLSEYPEQDLLGLHGFGPASMPVVKRLLSGFNQPGPLVTAKGNSKKDALRKQVIRPKKVNTGTSLKASSTSPTPKPLAKRTASPESTSIKSLTKKPAKTKTVSGKSPESKQTGTSGSSEVDRLVRSLDPSLHEPVRLLREIIRSASPLVEEQVKWNSPAFLYTGEMKPFDPKEYKRDIVVMNLHRGRLMLVFPTGARVKDESGLLSGDYKDGRRIISFSDVEEIKKHRKALTAIVRQWISLVD